MNGHGRAGEPVVLPAWLVVRRPIDVRPNR
jgi:hypothetical protein